ncbi:anhydro-N-acetylmuramic acid kinase [Kitasatospora indigofera]|uniref:anhydro-N-acetylmuramic acid kinase n=1 Tax=Kitasatospora indigofera TaxID=67307 RepID=UPI00362F0C78
MKVLGMMSGTSHDAIDTAVVELVLDDDNDDGDGGAAPGPVLRGRLLHHGAVPYPDGLRAELAAALPPHRVSMAAVCRLDTLIGQAFARAAAEGAAAAGGVDLVVSHGQTVYHWVEHGTVRGTLQLGRPAWIAEAAGAPVVADLRARDVAAGGQGAPLVALFDTLVLAGLPDALPGAAAGGPGPRRGALNLGGIANLTVPHSPDGGAAAYDTGPANALLDAAVLRATGEHYDRDGALAARGRVDTELLALLLAEPYYRRPAPKSTGKELFHSAYLERMLTEHRAASGTEPADPDLLATLVALTARTVADEVRRHGLTQVLVSGGGCRNPVLLAALAAELPEAALVPSEAAGLPSDAKEAVAFAVLGWYTVHGLPASVPACTGARGARVLGSLTPGPHGLPRPDPVRRAPVAAVFGTARGAMPGAAGTGMGR